MLMTGAKCDKCGKLNWLNAIYTKKALPPYYVLMVGELENLRHARIALNQNKGLL